MEEGEDSVVFVKRGEAGFVERAKVDEGVGGEFREGERWEEGKRKVWRKL